MIINKYINFILFDVVNLVNENSLAGGDEVRFWSMRSKARLEGRWWVLAWICALSDWARGRRRAVWCRSVRRMRPSAQSPILETSSVVVPAVGELSHFNVADSFARFACWRVETEAGQFKLANHLFWIILAVWFHGCNNFRAVLGLK